jgi:alpha-mannosidase II
LEDKLRQAEILFSFAAVMSNKVSSTSFDSKRVYDNLEKSRRELSLFQHHDGVAGTAKSYVMNDYESRLLAALEGAHQALESSLSLLSMGNAKDQTGGAEVGNKVFLVDLSDNTR